MAIISCGMCNGTWSQPLYEHWYCPHCSDFAIRLNSYDPEELQEAFDFIHSLRNAFTGETNRSTLVLAKDLESPENVAGKSLLDTLLLFFDEIVIPDFNFEDVFRLLGIEKAEKYRENNLIKTSDNSFVECMAVGLQSKKSHASKYDFQLANPKMESALLPQTGSVCFDLFLFLQNLEHVYQYQLLESLQRTHLFKRNRNAETGNIHLRGQVCTPPRPEKQAKRVNRAPR